MSAGGFQKARYELDGGDVAVVRVQPETLGLDIDNAGTNSSAPGAASLPGLYPLNLGGRRRKPFSARYVAVRFTSTLPDGYKAGQVLRVPIMTPALFNAIPQDATGTYLGEPVEILYTSRQQGG